MSIYTKKYDLEKKAVQYLNEHLSTDSEEFSAIDLRINLSTEDRGTEWYNIDIFKALFNSGDEELRIALWNNCINTLKDDYCKDDFTAEEIAFIDAVLKAQKLPFYGNNVNDPIEADRLVLRAVEKEDFDLFARAYRKDGDFFTFTGREQTDENISLYANREEPLLFAIVEKSSNRVVGCVGLCIDERYNTCMLEYYIFKKYRKKGYCKEAVQALAKMALNQKLFLPKETVRDKVFDRDPAEITSIRARIETTNEPSKRTVQACGFVHEATLHKTLYLEGLGWVDEDIYYLTK